MRILYKITIFAIAPGLFRLWYFYHRDNFQPEPKKIVAKVFLFGVLVFAPAGFIEFGLKDLLQPYLTIATLSLVSTVFFAPITEEIIKFGGFKRSLLHYNREVDEPIDAMIYGIAIGLGFASIENLFYVAIAYKSGLFVEISLLRAMITVPAHAIFGSMRGYAVGMAKFNTKLKHPKMLICVGILMSILLHILLNFFASLGEYWEIFSLVCMIGASIFFRRLFQLGLKKLQKLQTENMYLDWYFDTKNVTIYQSKEKIMLTDYAKRINKIWNEDIAKNLENKKKLYNGQIYFLEKYTTSGNKLNLYIGLTEYKLIYGRRRIMENSQFTHIEPIRFLYVDSIIQTSDGKFVLGVPSGITVSAEGKKYQTIGGLCSPDEIKLEMGNDLEKVILKEIKEEIGLDDKYITSLSLIGGTQTYIVGNIGLIFVVKLNIDADILYQNFKTSSKDQEMSDIVLLDRNEMINIFESMPHSHYPKLAELLTKRAKIFMSGQ